MADPAAPSSRDLYDAKMIRTKMQTIADLQGRIQEFGCLIEDMQAEINAAKTRLAANGFAADLKNTPPVA
jgi:hypothetical protein